MSPNLASHPRRSSDLRLGPTWASFEKLRAEGSRALECIKPGSVGRLTTKQGSFAILRDEDFQTLLGLARDVERLQGGLNLIVSAARAMQKYPTDPDLTEVLIQAVVMMNIPAFSFRDHYAEIQPEGLEVEEEDGDYILDPSELIKPF